MLSTGPGMAKTHQALPFTTERKYRRFPLQLPVHVTIVGRGFKQELEAFSQNVSVGGLLLEIASPVPDQSFVSFVMKVNDRRLANPVTISGTGKVVRVEEGEDHANFRIAVACERPLTHIHHLAAAS